MHLDIIPCYIYHFLFSRVSSLCACVSFDIYVTHRFPTFPLLFLSVWFGCMVESVYMQVGLLFLFFWLYLLIIRSSTM